MDALETDRLRLEPWQAAHAGMLARLAALPEVMRYVADGVPWDRARADELSARQLVHWRTHGFGWRAAFERESGRAVGLISLAHPGTEVEQLSPDDHEIGWWIDPAAWGRGYATEGGRAIVAEAFGRVQAPSVVARVQPANAASLAVCAALGLEPERDTTGRFGEPVRILRRRRG
jgi:RimJ/RimL family protein N-acetyltransferase